MKYLIALILICLVSIAAVVYHAQTQQQMVSQISMAPIVDEIVAVGVNLPPNKTITAQDIQSGAYPILAYQIAANQFVIDIPRRLGHLSQFDLDHEGNLNPGDPIFANLAFGYINHNGKKIRFVPIANLGVSSIILDLAHMAEQEKMGLPSGSWDVHNIFVMADNSRWISSHAPISTSFLQQLTPSESNQTIVYPLRNNH